MAGPVRLALGVFAALLSAALPLPASPPVGGDLGAVFDELEPRDHRRGLLWRIEVPGAEPSYLFGTMHVTDPKVTRLSPRVREIVNGVDRVCTEVAMTYEAMAAEMRAMFFADGRTLNEILDKQLYARVLAAGQTRSLAEPVLVNMKPWAVALTLSLPPSQDRGVLDAKLYTDAVTAGKSVCGLESAQEHSAVFDQLTLADQVYILRQTVENLPQMQAAHRAMVNAYAARDLQALFELSLRSPWTQRRPLAARLLQRLLLDRNATMVERIEGYLGQDSTLFAVGALHLAGRGGLLSRLERRGYRVQAVY